MPPECPGTSNFCAISVKTKRQSHKNRAYSVQDKEKIVAMIESGARNIDIVRKLNCPESTVRNIKRNLEETKKSIALAKKYYGSDGNAKRAMNDKGDRNRLLVITEHFLVSLKWERWVKVLGWRHQLTLYTCILMSRK